MKQYRVTIKIAPSALGEDLVPILSDQSTDTGMVEQCTHKAPDACLQREANRGEGGELTEQPEVVRVCQLRSASLFSMPIQVGERVVDAVVDTAAEATIISDTVYHSLSKKPPKIKDVTLHTAGRQMSMQGFIAGPVRLKIGSRWYEEQVYVAPIDQDMLLGFDILFHRGSAVLDMGRGKLHFDGQELDLNLNGGSGASRVARVTIDKRHVIPPNSVVRVNCSIDATLPDYVIEPTGIPKLLVPIVVRCGGSKPVVCIINPSERYRLLRKGEKIADAFPVHEYCEESRSSQNESTSVQMVHSDTPNHEVKVPEHLQNLYTASAQHLDSEQTVQLGKLLFEFQDVFAQDEFDLGHFTEIQHKIDTGDAKPIKQRIRRTPACFAEEEEAHLKKMLAFGVIQYSTSEWASAPVLIRNATGRLDGASTTAPLMTSRVKMFSHCR